MDDILEGLVSWRARQIENILKNETDKSQRMKIVKNTREDFNGLLNIMNFPENEMKISLKSSTDITLGLYNPYSKASCILMQLYSMEIGSPSLYIDANEKARDFDMTFLKELGPFLYALGRVTSQAEYNKSNDDRVARGFDYFGGVKYNLAGSFMLFRGAPMQNDWISPYSANTGCMVQLPQSTSTSKDPMVALGFAMPDWIKDNQTPTLFVFAIQNYFTMSGLTMNNEAYTAYPSEKEVLLSEGCKVYILGI